VKNTEMLDEVYKQFPSISIDKGIIEHSKCLKVVPASFGWNDIGNLQRLGEMWPVDHHLNAFQGDYFQLESANNVVFSVDKPIALLGVNDFVVINDNDVLLICPKSETERIGELLKIVRSQGRDKLL
jgi:mannose-1-phosphate guanylyltransferase